MLLLNNFIWISVLLQLSLFPLETTSYSIPGSNLKHGVWYSISMKDFSPGIMTWTSRKPLPISENVEWYLDNVFNLDNETAAKYKKGEEWFVSTLWKFIPSTNYAGWYKLKNGRFPDSYVTWSPAAFVTWQRPKSSNYVILERGRDEADYMLKPVFAEKSKNGLIEYHQLTMRRFPQGKINWSRHTENSHYIQNHHGDYELDNLQRYEKGQGLYSDTLFIFTEVECNYVLDNEGNYECQSGSKDWRKIAPAVAVLSLGIHFTYLLLWNNKMLH